MQFFFKPNPFKSWKWSCFIEQLKNLLFLLHEAVVLHSLWHAHEAFLKRSDFYYAVQSALIAQQYSFHAGQHWCFQRGFEIWYFLFFLCSERPSFPCLLPPLPALFSAGTLIRKSRSKWRSKCESEIQGVSSQNEMKFSQNINMLWFAARVKRRLKSPKDFEEGTSQGSCPENCVGVSQGGLSWKLLKWRWGMASWVKGPALRLGQRLEPQQFTYKCFCSSYDISSLNSLHIKYKSFSLCENWFSGLVRERKGWPWSLLFRVSFHAGPEMELS